MAPICRSTGRGRRAVNRLIARPGLARVPSSSSQAVLLRRRMPQRLDDEQHADDRQRDQASLINARNGGRPWAFRQESRPSSTAWHAT